MKAERLSESDTRLLTACQRDVERAQADLQTMLGHLVRTYEIGPQDGIRPDGVIVRAAPENGRASAHVHEARAAGS